MEQVHHKVKEYHTLELQRTANATAAAATAPAPAAGSERHLHGQQHGGGGGALHGHEKRELKEQLQVQQEHLQQQPLARKVRELREAAIATAQRDGTWLTNPALESTVRENAQGPHDAVKKNRMKWW